MFRYSIVFAVFLVVCLVLAGCGKYSDFWNTVDKDIKPRVRLLFQVYFGTDADGNYLTEADPDAKGQSRGIQDVVASKWNDFSESEQEKLKGADDFMVELLGDAKNVNDKLQKFRGTADEVINNLERIFKVLAGLQAAL